MKGPPPREQERAGVMKVLPSISKLAAYACLSRRRTAIVPIRAMAPKIAAQVLGSGTAAAMVRLVTVKDARLLRAHCRVKCNAGPKLTSKVAQNSEVRSGAINNNNMPPVCSRP